MILKSGRAQPSPSTLKKSEQMENIPCNPHFSFLNEFVMFYSVYIGEQNKQSTLASNNSNTKADMVVASFQVQILAECASTLPSRRRPTTPTDGIVKSCRLCYLYPSFLKDQDPCRRKFEIIPIETPL
jgi:hypothetical protein